MESRHTTCPNCGTKGSMVFSVYSNHAHIFWIPVFPYKKHGVAQCQHCKYTYESKQFPEELKQEYQNLKSEARTPIWQFAGLFLIFLLVAWGAYASSQDSKQEHTFLDNPASGDLYEYKTETGYSNFKIVEVREDSLLVLFNDYELDKNKGMEQLRGEENYSDEFYMIHRNELVNMYESDEILNIERN